MRIAAVGFDLDYTLVFPERDRQTLLDEATAAAGVRDIDRREYLDAHGTDVASETRAPIFDRLLDEGDPEMAARAYRDAVEEALVPVPGVAELIRELRTEYPVGLLTDGPVRAQLGKLDRLGWRDLFDVVVVTGTLPAGKPDPRAFETFVDRLGVPAEEIVYVGDDVEADVGGAKGAGLFAVQVCDGVDPDPRADASVDRDSLVSDLRELLSRQRRL